MLPTENVEMHQEWGFIYAVDIFKITLIYRLKAEILTRSLRTIHVYIYVHTYIKLFWKQWAIF